MVKKSTSTSRPKPAIPPANSAGGKLWHAINAFRGLSTTAPSYTIQVFLAVANNPGITITEIAVLAGIAQSQATRAVALLSETTSHFRASQRDIDTLGYIELYEDEADARRTRCQLSKRGERFWSTLQALIGDEPKL
jgi:hypothetical protein